MQLPNEIMDEEEITFALDQNMNLDEITTNRL